MLSPCRPEALARADRTENGKPDWCRFLSAPPWVRLASNAIDPVRGNWAHLPRAQNSGYTSTGPAPARPRFVPNWEGHTHAGLGVLPISY